MGQVWQWCPVQGKVVPKEQVIRQESKSLVNWEGMNQRENIKRGYYRRDPATGEIKHVSELGNSVPGVPREASHLYINDEMPPTLHPVDGKYYTSKAKFREVTKAHGFQEVGDAYDRGYNPEAESKRELQKTFDRQSREFIERYREARTIKGRD